MAGSCREWLGRTARRIATDTTWVFVIVMSLSIGSTFFSIRYLSGLESDLGELYENDIKGQTYAQNAYVSLLGMESELKDLIISDGGDRGKPRPPPCDPRAPRFAPSSSRRPPPSIRPGTGP